MSRGSVQVILSVTHKHEYRTNVTIVREAVPHQIHVLKDETRGIRRQAIIYKSYSIQENEREVASINPFPHTKILQQATLNVFCQNIENRHN